MSTDTTQADDRTWLGRNEDIRNIPGYHSESHGSRRVDTFGPQTPTWADVAKLEATDTSLVDAQQLAGIVAALTGERIPFAALRTEAEQGDPQWAGPNLPHPTEATSEQEADELQQGWDDWQHGIDQNTNEEASL